MLVAGLWKVRLKASPGRVKAKLVGKSGNNQSMGNQKPELRVKGAFCSFCLKHSSSQSLYILQFLTYKLLFLL